MGKPLYLDAIIKACTRQDFAHVFVMLNISSTLLKHIFIMVPKEDVSETSCKVYVEYEWVPPKCVTCMSFRHLMKAYPSTKPVLKPAMAVYVQPPLSMNDKSIATHCSNWGQNKVGEMVKEPQKRHGVPSQPLQDDSGKGKELVLYNQFDALMLDEKLNEATSSGPKQSSPPNNYT
ncbi:UNVERIFIED_CONTAM: hypothetical protein Sradi_2509500 [Sesamum radiatum]|uniref:Uncharacterized protein n=1 Tax=Sesamum radiatum TaxID=300843 RepID=A0AAW2SK80_SESRA